jgi:hypothetical protein
MTPFKTALVALTLAPALGLAAPSMSPDTGSDAVRALHSSADQVSFGIAADYHYVKSADGAILLITIATK